MVGLWIVIILQITVFSCAIRLYPGFDYEDLAHAECIPIPFRNKYLYFGTRDHTLLGKKCMKWKHVYGNTTNKAQSFKNIAKNVTNLKYELNYEDNNYCRNVQMFNKFGPWCVVEMKGGTFEPQQCFPLCELSEYVNFLDTKVLTTLVKKAIEAFDVVEHASNNKAVLLLTGKTQTANGKQCMQWSKVKGKKFDYGISFAGCQNPDDDQKGPWCYVGNNKEHCFMTDKTEADICLGNRYICKLPGQVKKYGTTNLSSTEIQCVKPEEPQFVTPAQPIQMTIPNHKCRKGNSCKNEDLNPMGPHCLVDIRYFSHNVAIDMPCFPICKAPFISHVRKLTKDELKPPRKIYDDSTRGQKEGKKEKSDKISNGMIIAGSLIIILTLALMFFGIMGYLGFFFCFTMVKQKLEEWKDMPESGALGAFDQKKPQGVMDIVKMGAGAMNDMPM